MTYTRTDVEETAVRFLMVALGFVTMVRSLQRDAATSLVGAAARVWVACRLMRPAACGCPLRLCAS